MLKLLDNQPGKSMVEKNLIVIVVRENLCGCIEPLEKSKGVKRMPTTKIAEKRIGMPEIRMKAKSLGLKSGKIKKAELIHAIQVAEGCMPCFGKSDGQCSYIDCCFMTDCFKIKL